MEAASGGPGPFLVCSSVPESRAGPGVQLVLGPCSQNTDARCDDKRRIYGE